MVYIIIYSFAVNFKSKSLVLWKYINDIRILNIIFKLLKQKCIYIQTFLLIPFLLTFNSQKRMLKVVVLKNIERNDNIWSFYFCFFLPRTIFPIQRFCAKHSEEGMLVARWLQPQVCRLILGYSLLIHRRLTKYKDGSCVKLLLRCYFTSCQMLKKMLIVALFILLYSRVTVLE